MRIYIGALSLVAYLSHNKYLGKSEALENKDCSLAETRYGERKYANASRDQADECQFP